MYSLWFVHNVIFWIPNKLSDAVLIDDKFPSLAVKVKAAPGDMFAPQGEKEHFLCRTLPGNKSQCPYFHLFNDCKVA